MSIIVGILKSLKDGRFFIKLLNRFSQTRYVPSPESGLNRFLAEHYPRETWEHLPSDSKQILVQFSPIFTEFEINNIAYVGAHKGEIALAMDKVFPHRNFYLIEPVPVTFQELMGNVSSRPNMKCFNLAVGAEDEELQIFADDFSPASSFLPYKEIAIQEFPFLGQGRKIKVRVKTLDRILEESGASKIDLLIMDVQGYEDRVLEGGMKTIKTCKVIISELTLQEIYVGGSTFNSVYQTLIREGFQLKQFMNPITGISQRILQIDGIFVRC
jgi:FkbM family methyltransferase